ncbi:MULTISPECIES: DUF2752 domain-containing protein [Tenacibaculum]|uniref:DUF2752 domain-containing protein n=3 Tax=Tenacibaculum TaxID=104267 RepID=A0A9X4ERF1_9FLAO|nr:MULTISPECIES: DUF2752 domain-containing protein [Tenacibaculum]MDE1208053.1 DUF2752 domain-containing protein [Tenacibaculum larymnensis]MDP2541828.1 DUF2752 domain-containing protein [Tenacibaculum discolor]RLJ99588.1 uncharacterized protein DUF2752 [Tenacibaculum discolor]
MPLQLEDYMLPCLNKKFFGVDCLGCGIQRALSLVFHGEFIAAFKMYPAIYTLLLLAIAVSINFFYKVKYAQKIISILAIINIIIIVSSYVIKMNQLI